jgi:hypothetical protein
LGHGESKCREVVDDGPYVSGGGDQPDVVEGVAKPGRVGADGTVAGQDVGAGRKEVLNGVNQCLKDTGRVKGDVVGFEDGKLGAEVSQGVEGQLVGAAGAA